MIDIKEPSLTGFSECFLNFGNIDFQCPYCNKEYSDNNEFYYKRIVKNKSGITRIKCQCNSTFCLTPDIKGDLVTFKIESNLYRLLHE